MNTALREFAQSMRTDHRKPPDGWMSKHKLAEHLGMHRASRTIERVIEQALRRGMLESMVWHCTTVYREPLKRRARTHKKPRNV